MTNLTDPAADLADTLDALLDVVADRGYSTELYRRDGRWCVRLWTRDHRAGCGEPYGSGCTPLDALRDAWKDAQW